ncbi:hypothetical protein NDU88_002657 [Pleurodeles waltl]|uniref:Uncharacterized protein n=1 Tax=Pleurodeles waltl TaxID=8319 RepID=A0AAV7QAK0_PLEWA|nr:hypothetical protein NDU88_002657 [Pleurodeles waltl]
MTDRGCGEVVPPDLKTTGPNALKRHSIMVAQRRGENRPTPGFRDFFAPYRDLELFSGERIQMGKWLLASLSKHGAGSAVSRPSCPGPVQRCN